MAVRINDGSGNPITSTAGALDVNVKSGTTLPVSATSLPLPAGAAQDGTDGTGIAQPTGGVGIRGWLSGIYKALTGTLTTAITGTVAVTGAFFQATQPISAANLPLPAGAAQDGTDGTGIAQPTGGIGIRGWLSGIYKAVTGTITTAISGTVAVTGTFFQATQPVSATALPLPTGAATSANQATPVAKGTQGATAEPTQDLKDSGRTSIIINIPEVASVAAEALLSLNQMKGGVQTAGITSYTVSAGKTLRLQALRFKARFTAPSTTVTFAQALINIRNAAVIAATNVMFGVRLDCAANLWGADVVIPFPDGWEFAAGTVIALSQLASATTLTLGGELIGYEY